MAQLNDLLVMGQSTLLGPVNINSSITLRGHLYANNGLTWTNANWIAPGNITCTAGTGGSEFSFDMGAGTQWHVWSTPSSTSMLSCFADNKYVQVHHHLQVGNYANGNYALTTDSFICNSEVQTISANAFRAVYGNYGVFLRNDGSNTYFLITASGDQYGSWNTLRPFYFNNANGDVTMGHNVSITGTLTATNFSSIQMNSSTAIKFPASTPSDLSTSTPMQITYGKVAAYGTLCINADTDASKTEYVLLTSGRGLSTTINDGLAVGYNTLQWLGHDVIYAKSGTTGTGNYSSLYSYGTADLDPGNDALATGRLYFVYE